MSRGPHKHKYNKGLTPTYLELITARVAEYISERYSIACTKEDFLERHGPLSRKSFGRQLCVHISACCFDVTMSTIADTFNYSNVGSYGRSKISKTVKDIDNLRRFSDPELDAFLSKLEHEIFEHRRYNNAKTSRIQTQRHRQNY